jgi:hypothetical protein
VRRAFAQCQESLEVTYELTESLVPYHEAISIFDGTIRHRSQNCSQKNPHIFSDLLRYLETGVKVMRTPLLQPPVVTKGFPEIKGKEELFRELPWQNDFEAIYQSKSSE